MKKYLNIPAIIAIAMSVFHIFTAVTRQYPAITQRSIHLAFVLAVVFSVKPIKKDNNSIVYKIINLAFTFIPLFIGLYMFLNTDRITSRRLFVDAMNPMDTIVSLIVILLVLEAGRRCAGLPMTILASVALLYGFFGQSLPGLIMHRGLSLAKMAELQFVSTQGILGVPIGVSANYVFYFLLFAAFLNVSGGGEFFINFAMHFTGRMRGGPAKAAVLSSGLMGTISGSAVANVVGTGIFTIPLMIKSGLKPYFAAAVEAVASTGGQLAPPIMGAAAFVMVELVGVPYKTILMAAIIPAILYYASLMFIIHLKALKEDYRALSSEEMPDIKAELLAKGILVIPLILLVYFIFKGYSLMSSALNSMAALIVLAMINPKTRLNLDKFLQALEGAAKQAVSVAVPCALAGILIGVLNMTGLGMKFSTLIIFISGGKLFLTVLFVMIGCIILGMGMPTTSAYIIGAIFLSSSLMEFGIEPLAAHFFIFYCAIMSMITPPVALASYTAAGIANCDSNKTSYEAIKIALIGLIIPITFILNPAILLIGEWTEIMQATVTSFLGVFCLGIAIVGWFKNKINKLLRAVLFVDAFALLVPGMKTDIIGLVIMAVILLYVYRPHVFLSKKQQ